MRSGQSMTGLLFYLEWPVKDRPYFVQRPLSLAA